MSEGTFLRDTLVIQQGSFGVGLTSLPSYKLDVAGDGHFSGAVYAGNLVMAPSGASNTIRDTNGSETFIGYGSSSTVRNVRLGVTGSELVVLTNGNIGIGTTSPSAPLDLETAGNTADGTYYSSFTINNTGTSTWSRIRFDRGGVARWGLSLGTDDKFKISNLFTNGTTTGPDDSCFVVDNTSNIGIGTNSPARKLDLTASGQMTFGDDVVPNNAQGIYWNSGSGYGIYRTAGGWSSPDYQQLMISWSTGIILGPGSGNYGKAHVGVVGGVSIGDSYYSTMEDNGLIVQGSVGIGTNNPGTTLDVRGEIRLDSGGATDRTIYFRNQSSSTTGGAIKSDQYLSLWAGNGAGSPTQYITIRSGGSVGIGNISPLQKLHVDGSILLDGVNNGYQQAATRGIGYGSNSGVVSVDGFSGMDIQSVNAPSPYAGNYSQNLRFFTHHWGAQTGGTPRMFIQYDGRVGIGTTTPTVKLSVNGELSCGDGMKLTFIGLDINSQSTPSFIKIRTKIPFASGSADFTVNIKGFQYNSAQMTSLTVGWHYYNSTFYSAALSSSGAYAPVVKLSAEDWDSSGTKKVCIVLVAPGYWPKLYVESMYSSAYSDAYADGWTWDTNDATATGSELVTPAYKSNFGNNFVMLGSGNVGIGTGSPSYKLHVAGEVYSPNLARKYNLPNTGGSASYVKIGTLNTAQSGRNLYLKIVSASGYNASEGQNAIVEVFFRTSNNSSSQSGTGVDGGSFYGSAMAQRNIALGGNTSSPSVIRIVQTSVTEYVFYGAFNSFTGTGSFYEVITDVNDTWTNSATTVSEPTSGTLITRTPSIIPYGAGATGKVTVWDAAYSLGYDTNLSWDFTNDELTVGNGTSGGAVYMGGPYMGMIRDNNYDLSILASESSGNALYLRSAGSVYVSIDDNANDTTKAFIVQKDAPKSGVELFRVEESGNVGIGTNSPQDKLDVNGTVSSKAHTASDWAMITYNSSGNAASGIWYTSYNAELLLRNASSSLDIRLHTGGNSYINTGYNVGIGTSNPGYRLDIQGGTVRIGEATYNANLLFGNSSTWRSGIRVYDNGDAELRIWHRNTDGQIVLATGYDGDGSTSMPTDGLFIAGDVTGVGPALKVGIGYTAANIRGGYAKLAVNGNVGIGTANPVSNLQVGNGTSNSYSTVAQLSGDSGGASVLSALSLVNSRTAATGNGVAIDFHTASNYSPTARIATVTTGAGGVANADLRFYTYNSGLTQQMVLDRAGYLGIGTPSPSQKLHVHNGRIAVTDGYNIGSVDGNTGMYVTQGTDVRLQVANTHMLTLTTGALYPAANGTKDLGLSGNRWNAVYSESGYFSNGVVVTEVINGGFEYRTNSSWGGWARNAFTIADGSGTDLVSYGGYGGSGTTLAYGYLGKSYTDYCIAFQPDGITYITHNGSTKFNTESWGVKVTGSLGVGGSAATSRVVTITNIAATDRPAIKIINPNFSSNTSSTGKTFYRWLPIDIDGTTRWIAIYS